jgi:predicted regulator of Ras-like GTPase activity (Roadblock/LC7/MglB family)
MSAASPLPTHPESEDVSSNSAKVVHVGTRLLPILEQLHVSLPAAVAVVVSTADGFNVCALGVDEHQVERVCALGGSLHSMVSAVTEAIIPDAEGELDLTSITHGEFTTVVLAVPVPDGSHLLLWITTSQDTTMGSVIYHTRETAAAIRAELDRPN